MSWTHSQNGLQTPYQDRQSLSWTQSGMDRTPDRISRQEKSNQSHSQTVRQTGVRGWEPQTTLRTNTLKEKRSKDRTNRRRRSSRRDLNLDRSQTDSMRTPDTHTDTLELLDTFRQCLPDPLSDSYQKAKQSKSLKDNRLVQKTGTTQNRIPEMAKTKDEQSLFPVLCLSNCNVNFRKTWINLRRV